MTAKENKRQPLSTGSEWTFELIQAYDALERRLNAEAVCEIEAICKLAG